MAYAPTDAELLDLEGIGQRIDGFRFDLYDHTDTWIDTLHPSRGSVPTVSNDTSRAVRRQLSGMLLMPDEIDLVTSLSARVKVVQELENGSEYQLGVFLLGDRSQLLHSWGSTRAVTWSDKMQLLNQPITRSLGFQKGADVAITLIGVCLQVLTYADLSSFPISDVVFGAPIAYPANTNRLTIIEDLAKLLGWYPPFFDRFGLLQFIEVPDINTAPATQTALGPGTRVIADSESESDNLIDAPNQFVVVEASGRSTLRGVYNVSDAAPHSAVNRDGRIIPKVESVQGLNSTSQANKAARARAVTARKGIFREKAVETTSDPRFDTWDVVPVYNEALGTFEQWVSLAWSVGCRSGRTMSHKLRRVY